MFKSLEPVLEELFVEKEEKNSKKRCIKTSKKKKKLTDYQNFRTAYRNTFCKARVEDRSDSAVRKTVNWLAVCFDFISTEFTLENVIGINR